MIGAPIEITDDMDLTRRARNDLTRLIIRYEIAASWWASWVGWGWGQSLTGKYFAWKVRRKLGRYLRLASMPSDDTDGSQYAL